MTETSIRPLQAADEPAWRHLWTGYLTFYGTSVDEVVYRTTFARLLGDDPHDFSCLLAVRDGMPIGLAHYLFHRHCWRLENVIYLQDLFVEPAARGSGAGRALIEAVYVAADCAGCPMVHWTTQVTNHTARRLYDRIAEDPGFMRYERRLPT